MAMLYCMQRKWACSLKARGKATKLKKQIFLQKHLRVYDLQGELTPEIYFACWCREITTLFWYKFNVLNYQIQLQNTL
jgi:hypothetical protein